MNHKLGVDFMRGIVMRAPNMTSTAEFYETTWGLKIAVREDDTVYLRGTGPEPFIYGLTDGDDFGIEFINFGMDTSERVDQLYSQLIDDGIKPLSEPGEVSTPGGGYGFSLLDPDNRELRIVADVAQNDDIEDMHAMPIKVSHVVLNTPDIKTAEAFYTNMLGFRLSDYYVDQMAFLRCSTDHHSIGLFQNSHASANHVAFEMPNIDSFMRGIGRLKQVGHVPSWGPGRHGPGNNPFAYYVSPSGFVIEFTTELQQIDEATHVVQEWPWGDPEKSDRWMTAGPPTPAMRAVMLGRPDRGRRRDGGS